MQARRFAAMRFLDWFNRTRKNQKKRSNRNIDLQQLYDHFVAMHSDIPFQQIQVQRHGLSPHYIRRFASLIRTPSATHPRRVIARGICHAAS